MWNELESSLNVLKIRGIPENPNIQKPEAKSADKAKAKPKKYLNQDIHEIRNNCRKKNSAFYDNKFPPSVYSIFKKGQEGHQIIESIKYHLDVKSIDGLFEEIVWQRLPVKIKLRNI